MYICSSYLTLFSNARILLKRHGAQHRKFQCAIVEISQLRSIYLLSLGSEYFKEQHIETALCQNEVVPLHCGYLYNLNSSILTS